MLLKSLEMLATLGILLALGAFLRHRKFVGDSDLKFISFITIKIAIACTVFLTTVNNYDRESLIAVLPILPVPFISTSIVYIIANILAILIKVPRHRRGVFSSIIAFSNVVLIGFPIATSVLGDSALAYGTMQIIVNTFIFWSLAAFAIRMDARVIRKNNGIEKESKKVSVFKIIINSIIQFFNPVIIAFILSISVVLADINLPVFLMRSIGYLGTLATPLAMLYLGISMCDASRMKFKYTADILVVILGRFIVAPVTIFIVAKTFNVDAFAMRSFILFSSISAMNQISIVAGMYDADREYAAACTVATLASYPAALVLYSLIAPLI